MKIQRHIFGSQKGYKTLAQTSSLDPRNLRRLESFAFGQTARADYLESLTANPAYICRALDENTFTLTRVLPGAPDDNGRATLLLVSAILDTHEWICTLGGDPVALLARDELWAWTGQQTLMPVFLSPPKPMQLTLDGTAAKQVAILLSVIERAIASGKRVVIPHSPAATDEIFRATMMLLPDQVKELVSSAYRALNPEMHVDLCWLAESVWPAAGPENHIHRLTDETPLTPYAIQLIRSGLADGRIAWDIVRTYQNFGLIKEESLPPKAVSKPAVESNLAAPAKTAEPTPVTETQPKYKHLGKLARSAVFLAALAVASGCVLGVGIGMSFDIAKQLNPDQPDEVSVAQRRNLILGRILLKLARPEDAQPDSSRQLRMLIEKLRKIDPVAAELADLAWEKAALVENGSITSTKKTPPEVNSSGVRWSRGGSNP